MRVNAVHFAVTILLAASALAWQNEDRCTSRDANNNCLGCSYSYSSGPDCIVPKTVIPGCYGYASEGNCLWCQDGYYQNANAVQGNANSGFCTPLNWTVSSFCTESNIDANTCTKCKNGVLAVDGVCQLNVPCHDPNCDTCSIDPFSLQEGCSHCRPNHFLFTGVSPAICVPIRPGLENCYSSNNLYKCVDCDYGFAYNNGTCYKSAWTVATLSGSRLSIGALIAVLTVAFAKI